MTMTDVRPQVEFDQGAYQDVLDAYRHEDGSITYIVPDYDCEHVNPREDDGNVTTLIQENDRYLDIDEDEAGLREAREHFSGYGRHGTTAPTWGRGAQSRHDREYMMERYLAMFRPDILHYEDSCSFGDYGASRGWGYVTREAWEEWMYPDKPYVPDDATPEVAAAAAERFLSYEPSVTPKEAFDQEVDLYRQWANGEVYGAWHVSVGDPIVVLGEYGAYIDGYEEDEDSCWGFLGYDDRKEIAESFTDSPVTEVLY